MPNILVKRTTPGNSIIVPNDRVEDRICDKLILDAKPNFQPATIHNTAEPIPYVSSSVRNNQVCWGTEQWVYDYIWPKMMQATEDIGWNYQLASAESYQIAKSEVGEFHDWHQDGLGQITYDSETDRTRKLSLSLLLNDDYEGGELEVFPNAPMKRPKGTMIFFPSFQCHQVHPVTKGTRYSLVMWFSGKPWQ